jgi:uncharacterized protein
VGNDVVRVGNVTCEPGQLAKGRIEYGYDRDGTECALPVMMLNGTSQGPTVYLGALVHGNEPAGVEVIRRVMREQVRADQLAGAIIAIPVQNPHAFKASSYHSPEDGLNANRIFPGDATESLTNRAVAAAWTNAVAQSDFVLDLHCNARDSILFNFVRTGPFHAGTRSVELSKAHGFTTVISHAKRHGFGFEERLVGLLADAALAAGKPTLTVELTPTYNWEESTLMGGTRGVLNVLRYLEMLPGDIEPQVGLPIIDEVLGPQLRVTPQRGGFLHPVANVGDWVSEGQAVLLVRDPWGDVIEEITSPADGYILSYPHHGNHAAASGDTVLFVAPRFGGDL